MLVFVWRRGAWASLSGEEIALSVGGLSDVLCVHLMTGLETMGGAVEAVFGSCRGRFRWLLVESGRGRGAPLRRVLLLIVLPWLVDLEHVTVLVVKEDESRWFQAWK